MKSHIYRISVFFVCVLTLVSCNKWLDVKPEDKTIEEDVFAHTQNIYKAVNAVYNAMAKPSLYGQQLTKSTLDVMAQYYNSGSTVVGGKNRYQEVVNFQYNTPENQAFFESIWNSSYEVILSANNLLEGFEKYDTPLTNEQEGLLKGELYGIRAWIHFDLLRLFGPQYQQDSVARSIPYQNSTVVELRELLPAKDILKLVMDDLNRAEDYLGEDPIINSGVVASGEINDDVFFLNRNRRINYYAILALKARVLLYQGDYQLAENYAQKVIDQAQQWFPWKEEQAHLGVDADRVFYSEVIFGLPDIDMYNSQKELFDISLSNSQLLGPAKTPDVARDIYEQNAQDFRFIAFFGDLSENQSANKPFSKIVVKYNDISSKDKHWRNFQPMIRMSEMYYILSECRKDVELLNAVRAHRGLEPLSVQSSLDNELLKEYRKEFLGEGQLFFYYKRTNRAQIKGYNLTNVEMDSEKYQVPLPIIETNQR